MRADAGEGGRLCLRPSQQPSDQQHMGTAFTPAKTSPASWDAFADVDAFVDAVLAELAAMAADGTQRTRSGPKSPLTGAALRKAILAIWCVCFCGMQWRAIGQLCDIPFGTLYSLFARWTRLGLWRRLYRDSMRCRKSRLPDGGGRILLGVMIRGGFLTAEERRDLTE